MELPCLPAETPSTASSSTTSTDPLYDNYCPPFAPHHHNRGGQRERDAGVAVAAVGRPSCLLAATGLLPATPCNNPGAAAAAGRAPTVPEVPIPTTTLQGGGPAGGRGAGPGFWPDHSYCSWVGGGGGGLGNMQGCWDAELRINRGGRGLQGRERSAPSPSPQSDEHQSALSVYDNLHDASIVTPDDLEEEEEEEEEEAEGIAMETCSFQEDDDTRHHHHVTGHIQQMMMMTMVEAEDGAASGGESSTWSSCEILLGGESADRTQEDVVPEQKIPEPDNMEVPPPPRLSHHLPTTSAGAGPPPPPPPPPPPHPSQGAGLLQAQAAPHHPEELPVPRVPPPVPLADPSASALRSILTSLQQQIGRQREDYETRIYSLEQRNEELLMEVVGLRANLAQQKRWYQAVQAKIAESEQARATAELHNAALQRELEQVFDTFGELNSEAMKTESIVRSF